MKMKKWWLIITQWPIIIKWWIWMLLFFRGHSILWISNRFLSSRCSKCFWILCRISIIKIKCLGRRYNLGRWGSKYHNIILSKCSKCFKEINKNRETKIKEQDKGRNHQDKDISSKKIQITEGKKNRNNKILQIT